MQIVEAYESAFRIVQEAVMRQHSLIGTNLLTRVEFYLLNQARQQISLFTGPAPLTDLSESRMGASLGSAEPSSAELGVC